METSIERCATDKVDLQQDASKVGVSKSDTRKNDALKSDTRKNDVLKGNENNTQTIEQYAIEQLSLRKVDARAYSPLALAYMGDCVYELFIRTMLVTANNDKPNHYHKKASALVKAEAQANLIKKLEPILTEEEHAVYKRGRNAKSFTTAKHATVIDYRMATGFEALIGYLYLKKDLKRIVDLIKIGLK